MSGSVFQDSANQLAQKFLLSFTQVISKLKRGLVAANANASDHKVGRTAVTFRRLSQSLNIIGAARIHSSLHSKLAGAAVVHQERLLGYTSKAIECLSWLAVVRQERLLGYTTSQLNSKLGTACGVLPS